MKKIIYFVFVLTFSLSQFCFAKTKEFKMVAVEVSGTKIWFPSVLVVQKGDKVKIHAESKVPEPSVIHGLAIKEFKVVEAVDNKGKDIEFVASKAGVFSLYCHLHEKHIGAQLVVLEK
ncbi:MAG: hypothetical protein AB7F43_13980 [Bacteriovoracia bacterium]